MKLLAQFANDILWLAAGLACAWFFPRTVLSTEVICALGTIALYRVEKST